MRWIPFVVLAASCYHARDYASCETSCADEARSCPSGQVCGSDLMCHGKLDPACGVAVDGPIVADALQRCIASSFALFPTLCFDPDLPSTITLAPTKSGTDVFDTGEPGVCRLVVQGVSEQDKACVVAAQVLRVEQPIHAIGPYPLVLVALDTIEVTETGHLDVGSDNDADGAGFAAASGCASADGTEHAGGFGGGGSGGAFGGLAGNGGDSGTGDAGGNNGSSGVVPLVIRGGCPGSPGGNSLARASGGGAMYLRAMSSIEIRGSLMAGGAGAQMMPGMVGASGGGSGGMIALEASDVKFTSQGSACATGGGGAGGNAGSPTTTGGSGGDGSSCAGGAAGSSTAATGGAGAGFARASQDGGAGQSGQTASSAGAGGGGSAGMIFVRGGEAHLSGAVFPIPLP